MNILFVCTGNTCRSPMAEAYLKSKKLPDLNVKSKGISAGEMPVSENSVKAMEEIGIDISGLYSEQLSLSDIMWADKILCMSESHKTILLMYTKEDKIEVLGGGVPDPFGGNLEIYKNCRDFIIKSIDELIEKGFFSEIYVVSMERKHVKAMAELEKICFSAPWSEDMILDFFMRGMKFFVAVKNGEVLGYIGIDCIIDEGYIGNLAVFPKHRNQGVASALLNRVFSLAKDFKLSFVSLEVRASNEAAISLYEKNGFRQEGRRKNFYRDPDEDALILTKRFD